MLKILSMKKLTESFEKKITTISDLSIDLVPKGKIGHFWLKLVSDGMGVPICIPIMVARGMESGEVVGITAALHGNELNGIPVIQRLFKELNPLELKGTVVGVPVANAPSFLSKKRRFIDSVDLNHIMPGKEDGNLSDVYAYRFFNRVIKHFDYLVDLHTASFGRINSYYIRADLRDPVTRKMAMLQNGQIVVHNPPSDGTLRGAASEIDIPAITLEVGDPNTFQKGMIRSGLTGIYNLLIYLSMIDGEIDEPESPTIICKSSYWIYTDTGGILRIHPKITEQIKEGDLIATIHDLFGNLVKEYRAPEDGVVIGRNTHPVAQTGSRIIHLGVVKK